jgi:NAD(P)-dependent dehydrogenase (short-subunit alcohol dehydrogenase family)
VTTPVHALVTGGSSGIGGAITRLFHSAGYRVTVLSREDSGLVAQLGERAAHVSCDVRQPADIRKAVKRAVELQATPGVLVNNAGYSAWRPLAAIDEPFWEDMLATNLKAVLFAIQAVVPFMPPGSCVINISSLAGKRGSTNNSVYCASKFGVNGLTQSLAKELGPQGIRVNAVCPVYVSTPGLEKALDEDWSPRGTQSTAAYLAEFAGTQAALGRLPTAEEVAAACLFLASPAASAITGQCLNVDCGVLPS